MIGGGDGKGQEQADAPVKDDTGENGQSPLSDVGTDVAGSTGTPALDQRDTSDEDEDA